MVHLHGPDRFALLSVFVCGPLPGVQEVMSERLKEQQEMERKLQKSAKQLDHLER